MKTIANNKKALFDYEIQDKFDAGIMLTGPEVKSCRINRVNLKGSYITTDQKDLFTEKMHIGPYQQNNQQGYDPFRRRKILLKKKEIIKIIKKMDEKGVSVIPLEMYLKDNLMKLKIAICKGKKKYDKRESLKKKDLDMQMKRVIKRY